MAALIANARMYSVTPAAEKAWRALLEHIAAEAGVAMEYFSWPAPKPLEPLWSRADLGAVQMCGFPVALGLAPVQPIAAPVPDASWAGGRALYRSDFIVRAGSGFQTLEDTFGRRFGWTVAHSQSGFNAPRHHLLRYRTLQRPKLFAEVIGNLVTARAIVDAVIEGRLDVGPLDAYWHMLLKLHHPGLAAWIRIVQSTDTMPMPPFVGARDMPPETVRGLRAAFVAAAGAPWFAALAAPLRLAGFAPAARADYDVTLLWDAEARAAGYAEPG